MDLDICQDVLSVIHVLEAVMAGPRLSEKGFFEAMDLSCDDLHVVKVAVEAEMSLKILG
mgnify:CR=1 FL=1